MALRATTILENTATVVAGLLLLWMLSRPFTINRAEAKTLDAVFMVIQVSLIAGWFAGLFSVTSLMLVMKGNAGKSLGMAKNWGWISIAANILVTVTIFTTPRVGAIAGPP